MKKMKCRSCKYYYLEGEWNVPKCEKKTEGNEVMLLLYIEQTGKCPYYETKEYWEPGY